MLHALCASNEPISFALRTLEFWIDHQHPGFLAPLLSPVMRQLLLALTQQLLPAPRPFGPSALRILDKLGASNRQLRHDEHRECTRLCVSVAAVSVSASAAAAACALDSEIAAASTVRATWGAAGASYQCPGPCMPHTSSVVPAAAAAAALLVGLEVPAAASAPRAPLPGAAPAAAAAALRVG